VETGWNVLAGAQKDSIKWAVSNIKIKIDQPNYMDMVMQLKELLKKLFTQVK